MINDSARAALDAILDREDPDVVGVVLTGSAARGMQTDHSDVDVYVVWAERAGRVTTRSAAVDEIPVTLAELEEVAPFGTEAWWSRWSFAWCRVLQDRTGGRLEAALRAQATLTVEEQRHVLLPGDRLDGFVNFVYRALKADRDGRPRERRLDAAESVPWFLDVVFTLAGRVRPYNKYLAWELREHPVEHWSEEHVLGLVTRLLDGDTAACREAFAGVDAAVRRWDAAQGGTDLGDLVDGWGEELGLLRSGA